jgi:hypothetical protein
VSGRVAVGPGAGGSDRGQFVLLAGVVVALALVAMLTAYLQLGYHVNVAQDTDRAVGDSRAFLDRATYEAARPLRGEHDWSQRGQAVTAMRDRLDPRLDTLERSRVDQGIVSRATVNASAASAWAGEYCPSGDGQAFGPCEADRGVVVQERTGRTLVLAVAYDLTVTTEDGSTRLTTVVNATG